MKIKSIYQDPNTAFGKRLFVEKCQSLMQIISGINWKYFFSNGSIDVDNNSTERAIRPITLFRKNSLFASNEHGGERAALFYSLVETCKLNGIDPFEYLNDMYNRLHDCTAAELIQLLPSNWKSTAARKTAM